MSLRPYQLKAISDLQEAYKRGFRAPIMSASTGSGKTHTASVIIRQSIAKGKRVWFMAHLREIIKATAGKLEAENIQYGYVDAGQPSNPELPVQIASVMTVAARCDNFDYIKPDLLIIDECHLAIADSYKRVIESLGNPRLLGLTGSPERLDGRGLGELFDIIIPTVSTMDLIDQGYAPTARYFQGKKLDLSGIQKRAGDFAAEEAEAFMSKPELIGDVVTAWETHAKSRPSIYFTCGVKHAHDMADAFCAKGYRFVAVSGESSSEARDSALEDLRAGRIDGVCNAQLWVAGVDVPNASCIGLAYISMSIVKYLQSIGRGMRIHPSKKDLVILDHGNLLEIHGNPFMERAWSLEGRKARVTATDPEDVSIKQCPQCFRIVRSQIMTCPQCGHIWTPQPREVAQVEGELTEVDLSKRIARIEQGRAADVDSLMKLGHSKYRAEIIVRARAEKKQLQDSIIADMKTMRLSLASTGEVRGMKPKALRDLREKINGIKRLT